MRCRSCRLAPSCGCSKPSTSEYPDGLDECLASGMLRPDGAAVAFRHEIARLAVENALSPHERVALHPSALRALESAIGGPPGSGAARASRGGAPAIAEAVLDYAPAAAERAAGWVAHREAAQQFARALREAESLPPERRAALLERRSYECYLTDQIGEAVEARREALAEHRLSGDRLRQGDAHRWLSRLQWFLGDKEAAEREADKALEMLEPLPPGRELAMAYSNMSQLRMLERGTEDAVQWGDPRDRVGRAARRARNPVARAQQRRHGRVPKRLRGRARRSWNEASSSRSRTDSTSTRRGPTPTFHPYRSSCVRTCAQTHSSRSASPSAAIAISTRGICTCSEYGPQSDLEQGRWGLGRRDGRPRSETPERACPDSDHAPRSPRSPARATRRSGGLGRRSTERSNLQKRTRELQRLAPVAAARAEARWLAGDNERVADEANAVLAIAVARHDRWAAGELLTWSRRPAQRRLERRRRADARCPGRALGTRARWRGRGGARRWRELGCPYEAALALAATEREDLLRQQRAGTAAARCLTRGSARRRERCVDTASSAFVPGPEPRRAPIRPA